MNDQDKIAEQAAEIARLTKTIEWYQGQAAHRIGETVRAEIAGVPVSAPQDDALHFNAQRLRNVVKLVGLESAVPQDDATLDGARGAVLGQIAAKLRKQSAVPQGSKLMPLKLTPGMTDVLEFGRTQPSHNTYLNLLAAAPAAPAEQAEPRRLAVMKTALQRISRWFGEFPETGKTWDDGAPMSYGAANGSNGERDYMRQVASDALTAPDAAPLPELTGPSEALPQIIPAERVWKTISALIDAAAHFCESGDKNSDLAKALDAADDLGGELVYSAGVATPAPLPTAPSESTEFMCGGFTCPICGMEHQHQHTSEEIAIHRVSESKPDFWPKKSKCLNCGQAGSQHVRGRNGGALCPIAASPSPAPAQQQEPIIFGIDYSGDYLAEVRDKALEEAAVVVLQGPFAGTRAGDAAAIRALKSSESAETAAPGASTEHQPMQILSDVEVLRLREVGATWMSQDGRDALDDWLLAVQSPPVAGASTEDRQ